MYSSAACARHCSPVATSQFAVARVAMRPFSKLRWTLDLLSICTPSKIKQDTFTFAENSPDLTDFKISGVYTAKACPYAHIKHLFVMIIR